MSSLNRSLGAIQRAGALFRAKYLAGTGIGAGDHTYLFYLCRNGGVSQETLARELFVDKSQVTRHVAHLEKEGFVRRDVSPHDGRVLLVYPTDKAMEILPLLRAMGAAWRDVLTADFSDAERAAFEDLLSRASQNARAGVEEKKK